jgi:3D (Asp-Asp-Asp) domain-containing protein
MRALALSLYATIVAMAIVLPGPAGVSPALAKAELQPGQSVIVVSTEGRGLRVRAGPGLVHPVVTTIGEGTTVRIGAGPVRNQDDDWYQIHVDGSTPGWSVGRYLEPSPTRGAALSAQGRRTFVARITAYADGVNGVPLGARTYSGTRTRWGVVAVDPKVIPLGSLLRIDGFDGATFLAEDTGGGIKGQAIDIWLPDPRAARAYGTQYRRVTVIREGPAR